NTNDVLVKVHAGSLNPIDIRICEGYGANFMFRGYEFPLVIGRDFSGTVVDIGTGVFDIQLGDDVYGAPKLHQPGCLDYICVGLDCVVQKPATLSHIEAASLPYVGLTVLSALKELVVTSKPPKRALVLGGSGGIGTFAIQYLRAYGFTVVTTCSSSAMSLCSSLGAECIDYKTQDVEKELQSFEKFNIVFDAIGAVSVEWSSNILIKNGYFVTLKSPAVENVDKFGTLNGLSTSASTLARKKLERPEINTRWAYYKPDRRGLLEIARLVDSGVIQPVLQTNGVYDFNDVPKAFKALSKGSARGKSVINVS
uniref:Enoyl reductase (ER) domain-containing protein n=1 Tax=Ciona savignyi TaxID=51511 RepID=H2Z232_CIOSA